MNILKSPKLIFGKCRLVSENLGVIFLQKKIKSHFVSNR